MTPIPIRLMLSADPALAPGVATFTKPILNYDGGGAEAVSSAPALATAAASVAGDTLTVTIKAAAPGAAKVEVMIEGVLDAVLDVEVVQKARATIALTQADVRIVAPGAK